MLIELTYRFLDVMSLVVCGAHRDRQPTVWRFYLCLQGTFTVAMIGKCAPYGRLIILVGFALGFLTFIIGGYVVVVVKDRDAERCNVKGGYKFMAGAMPIAAIVVMLLVVTMNWGTQIGALLNAVILAVFQLVVLAIVVP